MHLRRLAGVGAPASCRIFVFRVDYSRKPVPMQEAGTHALFRAEDRKRGEADASPLSPLSPTGAWSRWP